MRILTRTAVDELRGVLASTLLATTGLGAGTIFPTPAIAQEVRSYYIPAGPLASVLGRFIETSGVAVVYDAPLAQNVISPGLKGDYGPAEALSRILAGSGLAYRQTVPRAFTLEAAPAAEAGAVLLGPVRVDGGDSQTSAFEQPTGPVLGYVARRSTTATKTDTPIIEVPQSVSVIGREEMEARGALNIMDVVAQTPGISVNTYGPDNRGWEYIAIRGFSSNSGNFRDGLSQTNFGVVYYMTDPYAVERVEVLRGPSSVIYGQTDAGGIINRISKQPAADPIREVTLQYGSYDRKQAAFDFGDAANADETLAVRLVGLALDSNDQDRYPDGTRIDRQRYMLAPSLRWGPNADTSLTILGQWLESKSGEDPYYAIAANGSLTRIKMGDYSFSNFNQGQWSLGYEFDHKFSDALSFHQSARYSKVSLYRRAVWVNELLNSP